MAKLAQSAAMRLEASAAREAVHMAADDFHLCLIYTSSRESEEEVYRPKVCIAIERRDTSGKG